jgi:hypothetical protein
MVARKHSAREIVELLLTPQTAVSLSGTLMLVLALFGDLVRLAVGTPYTLRPAMGPDDLKTLGVVQQVKQIHGLPILPLPAQLPETQEEPSDKCSKHQRGKALSRVLDFGLGRAARAASATVLFRRFLPVRYAAFIVLIDPDSFFERWKPSGGSERANYASFLIELCELLGVPRPEPSKSTGNGAYVFEREVQEVFTDGTFSDRLRLN